MTEEKKDIQNLDDIKLLVDTFYGKIREDDLLKDIFNNVIQDRWPQHLDKMYRFWQTVLLDDDRTYYGSPFVPHAPLPVKRDHFNQWIKLFDGTVDGLFIGVKAERAKWQGERMADMFLMKIELIKERNSIPLK